MIKHRYDIDGLRALAVLPVVLFHANIPYFYGGFVGVDIFFVISGYLITSLILKELEEDQFSLRHFYVRRICRLLPAFFAMITATLLIGFFLLTASDLSEAARAARYSAFSLSNHLFWFQSNDYWMESMLSGQPLLHTWSLAVEEQFYLLVPFFMLFLWRIKKQQGQKLLLISMMCLLIVSLAISQWLLAQDLAAAFYLLPPRAWELLIGALLAFIIPKKLPLLQHRIIIRAAGTTGFFLVIFSIFFYDKSTSFPGFSALIPCFGASLIIYSGSQAKTNWVNGLLSHKILVFIGKISYSIYLWHWPILTLYHSPGWQAYNLPVINIWVLLAFIFFLSWASWRWIEQPFRNENSKQQTANSKQQTIILEWKKLGIGIMVSAMCWCLGAISSERISGKFRPVPDVFKEISKPSGGRCEGKRDIELIKKGETNCIIGASNTTPDFFIIGDSHARMWSTGLELLGKEYGLQGIVLAYSSCPPILGFAYSHRMDCLAIFDATLNYVIESDIQNVALAGRWHYLINDFYKNISADPYDVFSQKFSQTLEKLSAAGKHVYFVHDIPRLENEKIVLNKLMEIRNNPEKYYYSTISFEQGMKEHKFSKTIENLRKKYNFKIIDPRPEFFDEQGRVLIIKDSKLIYSDDNHLTDFGSLNFRKVFLPLMQDILEINLDGS